MSIRASMRSARRCAADAGGLVDQRRAEHRFEAAHQSPGVTLDISFDGTTADMGAGAGFVEDCAWNCDVIALKRGQHRVIADDCAKRSVRRPKVQTANRSGAGVNYSHSIVRIVPNKLIYRCEKFHRLENSRRPNRQMRMAFEFKEEFDRSRKSPLSGTIIIDRSTFLESTGNAAPPT
ncbi:hypothetical protein GRB70_21105 [Bradyrhizobium neotropicale]|nr:hypothetical protein [Bradyrhizobium neotropicale]